jgi:hypothetical protein
MVIRLTLALDCSTKRELRGVFSSIFESINLAAKHGVSAARRYRLHDHHESDRLATVSSIKL